MQQAELTIGGIPAVLYGGQGSGVYLYVHGKHGRKEEAAALADIVCPKGWQVLGIDLPCDSTQTEGDELVPWQLVPALRAVMDYVRGRWTRVALYAVSIGAWFSLLAFADARLENCLLVAPIVDMARLIEGRMAAAGVCADELRARHDRNRIRAGAVLAVLQLYAGASSHAVAASDGHFVPGTGRADRPGYGRVLCRLLWLRSDRAGGRRTLAPYRRAACFSARVERGAHRPGGRGGGGRRADLAGRPPACLPAPGA